MHRIIGLPISDLNHLERVGKKYEAETTEFMHQKYHVDRNTRLFLINTNSDQGMQLDTMLLACKMMRKCQVTSVPTYVIRFAGQCPKGICFKGHSICAMSI